MRAYIGGVEVEKISAAQRAALRLSAYRLGSGGRVLSVAEAADREALAASREGRLFSLLFAPFGGLICLMLVLSHAIPWFGAVAVLAGTALIIWLVRRRWRANGRRASQAMERRARGLPPPGTIIHADDVGLWVDEDGLPWSDLMLAALHLGLRMIPKGRNYYVVERVVVEAPGRTVTLDAALIEQGARARRRGVSPACSPSGMR